MISVRALLLLTAVLLTNPGLAIAADAPTATREFEIRSDRAYLGGQPVNLWGLRCGNALHSTVISSCFSNQERRILAVGSSLAWPKNNASLSY